MNESDQSGSASNGQASGQSTASQNTASEQAPGAQKLVTLDEVQRLIDQAVRQSQSMTDKASSRVQKELTEQVSRLQDEIGKLVKSGAEVPAELASSLAQAQEATQAANKKAELQPIIQQQVGEIQQKYGVSLVPGDGFYENVQAEGSAWQFLATLEEQSAAKAAALQQVAAPQNQTQRQTQQTTTARTPSLGPSAGQRVDGGLTEQYKKEMGTAIDHNATQEEKLRIRQKYRERGVVL